MYNLIDKKYVTCQIIYLVNFNMFNLHTLTLYHKTSYKYSGKKSSNIKKNQVI